MKIIRWIPSLILAGTCFAQCNPYPLRPSLIPPCPTIMDQVSKAIDTAKEYQKLSAEMTSAVVSARAAYWKLFPDRPGVREAELRFLKALGDKDLNYLSVAVQLGMNDPIVQASNLMMMDFDNMGKFPRNVDGGIRPYAFLLFGEWVDGLRRSQGRTHDGTFVSPTIWLDYYTKQTNWRRAYEDARNWAEFMASGLDVSKYVTPEVYIVNQMEADVAFTLARPKPADLPDPRAATMDLYKFFVKNFGEKEVLAAAAKALAAPKNSVGGLAQRSDVLIGTYQSQPSPNPYTLFLTQLTNATPHNYAMALCLDQYGLMGKDAMYTLNSKEQWDKAATTYGQLVARFGEPAIVAAAAKIKDLPKDGTGGIRGDVQAKGAIYWFTTLLKDPKTPLPESGEFLASSYDPRWIGKSITVRGTVSRVDIDKGRFPPYATIHFKESKNDNFTAYSPNSEILDEMLPRGQTSWVGSVLEISGGVSEWKGGGGIEFLIRNNIKVLNVGALANFKESSPSWMKLPLAPPPSNLADSPKYLAWKKFPVGSSATYYLSQLREYKAGTNQYTKTKIATNTFKLASVSDTQVVISEDSITYPMNRPPLNSTSELTYKAKEPKAADDPNKTTTQGEETLSINGKKIATRWVKVAQTNDPETYTKTWISDEVPGGLVWIQSQSNARNLGRQIVNNLYAPTQGVEPMIDDDSAPAVASPAAAPPVQAGRPMNPTVTGGRPMNSQIPNNPAPAAPIATPPVAAPSASAPATTVPGAIAPVPNPRTTRSAAPPGAPNGSNEQADIMERYRTIMQRYARDRPGMAQVQRSSNAGDLRTAQENMRKHEQEFAMALGKHDSAAVNQSLQGMEDTLTAIEKLTGQSSK